MPRKIKGSYEEAKQRWVFMVDGKRYRIKCADLGVAPGKINSYQAANAWIEQQVAKATVQASTVVDKVLEDWCGQPVSGVDKIVAMADLANHYHELPPDIKEHYTKILVGPDRYEQLRQGVDRLFDNVTPKTYNLEANAKRFLEIAAAKNNSPRTYAELCKDIAAIIRTTYKGQVVMYPDMDVRHINKDTVTNFYLYLRNERRGDPFSQKKKFGFFKRLLKYLWQDEVIDNYPRNLDATWDFNVQAKPIKEYDRASVIALLSRLKPRLKLYALLGLNCGMLAVDIGNLRKDEIDLQEGRITRKRSKTQGEKNVPVVNYKLWAETLKLLKQCLSADPVLALTTKLGTPLYAAWGDANGVHNKNMVRQQWKQAKTPIPHKAFRTIGATTLGEKTDSSMVALYLGHSPKTIQDRHYKAPSKERFDKLIDWLGRQFLGNVTT